jgi:transposase-like protein
MTKDHRSPQPATAQGVLLEDADFLREIVQRVLQEVLEVEMTEHIGADPTNAPMPAKAIETVISRGL